MDLDNIAKGCSPRDPNNPANSRDIQPPADSDSLVVDACAEASQSVRTEHFERDRRRVHIHKDHHSVGVVLIVKQEGQSGRARSTPEF